MTMMMLVIMVAIGIIAITEIVIVVTIYVTKMMAVYFQSMLYQLKCEEGNEMMRMRIMLIIDDDSNKIIIMI